MAESSIEVVCWDWNGTLLDDAELCRGLMNEVLSRRGHAAIGTLAEYRRRFHFPIRAFYASVGIDEVDFTQAADEYLALVAEHVPRARLHAGAAATLATVAEQGVRQVLASATVTDLLERQLAPHAIAGRFESVLGIDDAHLASKESVISRWVEGSGVPPERVLMIGDTNHDREIAARVGARFVHFDGGHQDAPGEGLSISALDALPALLAR